MKQKLLERKYNEHDLNKLMDKVDFIERKELWEIMKHFTTTKTYH